MKSRTWVSGLSLWAIAVSVPPGVNAVPLDVLCEQYPLNSRCARVEQGLPAIESGEQVPGDGSCEALDVVGGEGTEVTKTASVRRLPPVPVVGAIGLFTRNNWNTDFSVPPDAEYTRYIATLLAVDGGEFEVDMNLKYADESSDRTGGARGLVLSEYEQYGFVGEPRSTMQPNEVNLFVGGPGAVGQEYTLRVFGCRSLGR